MKKAVIALIVMMVFSAAVSAQFSTQEEFGDYPNVIIRNAADYSNTDSELKFVNQDPDPVEPGDYVDVRFKIENVGFGTAKDVIIELIPDYPFSLLPGDSAKRKVGDLNTQTIGPNAIIAFYKLKVSDTAAPSSSVLRLRYSTNGGISWVGPESYYIRIQGIESTLSVERVVSSPQQIQPGQDAKIIVTVKNLADSLIKDVSFRLDLSLSTLSSLYSAQLTSPGTELLALPFVPTDSATEKKIKSLSPDDTADFEFNIRAYPDAESMIYKVPIQMHYYDQVGTEYTKNDIIGLIVAARPELAVGLETTEVHRVGDKGNVVVKFVNKGLMNFRFVNVVLDDTEDYMITGVSEVYIGNIDSDDYETAEFGLYIEDARDGKITLPFKVTYKDSIGQEHIENRDVILQIYTSEEAEKLGLTGSNSPTWVIIIVVVVVVGFFVYRYMKKKKQKK